MRPSYDYDAWPLALEANGLTLPEFSELVMHVFELIFIGVKVRQLDGSSYNLTLPEKGAVTFDLANVWALCRDQPGRRREILAAFAAAMMAAVNAAFDPEAVDPALLIPVLRATKDEPTEREDLGDGGALESLDEAEDRRRERAAADTQETEPIEADDVSDDQAGDDHSKTASSKEAEHSAMELPGKTSDHALVPIRPFAGELSIYIAQDEPKSIRYLFPEDIESLDMPEPELFELAQSNLVRILNGHGVTIEPREGGIYNVVAGGDLESSLLLRGPFWKTVKEKLKLSGRIVAAAPIRGSLLFVDGDNAEHVYELRQIARSVFETGPHPLTAQLFGRYGDGWIAE